MPRLTALDQAIVAATQEGLPLEVDPWSALAARVGASREAVMDRLRALRASGVIRRIAAVPNHYRLGLLANGMTVWDVDDARLEELGAQVGGLGFVSHCYGRPRRPGWRYNLFAMVHGGSREEVDAKVAVISELLGEACRAREVLFSRRILKKTGFRQGGA